MSLELIADAGPLLAAANRKDSFHQRAQAELRQARRDQRPVIVSYSTVLETHSLLLRRLGPESAESWLADVLATGTMVNPTADDYTIAAMRLASFPDQPITLFDMVVALLAERLRAQVWTYDHHFDLMRADVWRP